MTSTHLQERLTAYFAGSGHEVGAPAELTGGWASSVYTVPLDDDLVVLKTYAPDGSAHAEREWRALTRLRAAGLAVPRGIVLEPDDRCLGRPFVVMEHVAGTTFWQAYEAADRRGRARLTGAFVAELMALHALDPQVLEPEIPADHLEHELTQLRRDSAGSPLVEVAAWLSRRAPGVRRAPPVLLHRDYHAWNVLVDGTGKLWVLDWDWQVGDPRFDVAWTCTLMRRSDATAFADAVRDEYERQRGRPLDDFGYFEVLTTLRWLLNVLPAAAERADFREFLVEPLRRARELLRARTGIDLPGPLVRRPDRP